ncbi:11034_t:CDS:2, partial [Cetraspora pellucida]
KEMNTTQMRVQTPRLGCLGECGHLCLIPLNNVVWKNNINDAAIYDFPIPDSTGVKLMKEREQDTPILAQQCEDMLMASW